MKKTQLLLTALMLVLTIHFALADDFTVFRRSINVSGNITQYGDYVQIGGLLNVSREVTIRGEYLNLTAGSLDVAENITMRSGLLNLTGGNLTADYGFVRALNLSGALLWSNLYSYPVACPAGSFLTELGDSVTCTVLDGVIGSFKVNGTLYVMDPNFNNGNVSIAVNALNITTFNVGEAGQFNFSVGGRQDLKINSSGLYGSDGSATSPFYSFESDPDTGLFSAGGNLLGVSAGGAERWRFSTALSVTNVPIQWSAGTAVTATAYEITRDADATNQLHFNVPTGATYEFSVNDVASVIVSAGGTINSGSTGNSNLVLQNQVFTPSATHNAVEIAPSWASENFVHTALRLQPVQNGANTQALRGLSITMTKATGATTLDVMSGLYLPSPTITGAVTNNDAIRIEDQTNAGATTSRGITFVATGVANSIWWGASALQYANAANNIRFMDSTNGEGIEFILTNSNLQTINTVGGSLNLSTGNVSRMSINGTTGYVGINNSNPQELLHVGNSTQASAQTGHGILMSNTGQAWVSARDPAGPTEAGVMAIGTVGYVGTWTSHQLIFRTGDTDRWNIDTNGNLGSNTAGGVLRFGAGDAITATEYEVARDADATNQLHFNVPTGAGFEFSVNDVAQIGIFDGGIRSRTGDAGNPSYTFIGDTNTGLAAPSADTIGITTNSDFRLLVNNTHLNITLPRIYFAPATVITFADRVNFSSAFSFNTSHIIPAVNNATILGVQGVINASESSPFAFKEIIVNRVSSQANYTQWIFNQPVNALPPQATGISFSTFFSMNDTPWLEANWNEPVAGVRNGRTINFGAVVPLVPPDVITSLGIHNFNYNVSMDNNNFVLDANNDRICLGCTGLNLVSRGIAQTPETLISDNVNITTLIQIDSAGNHNFTMQQVVCVNGTGYLGVCTTQPNATGGCNCQARVI